MPFQAKFKAREYPFTSIGTFFGDRCHVDRMKPLKALDQKTPFAGHKGEFNYVVLSEKYDLSLYFTPDTKEHECLKSCFQVSTWRR